MVGEAPRSCFSHSEGFADFSPFLFTVSVQAFSASGGGVRAALTGESVPTLTGEGVATTFMGAMVGEYSRSPPSFFPLDFFLELF